MSWNNRVNSNYREERSSTPIYALRKEGELEEAYQLALRLYQQDPTDDDINKAFSWVLIDLCKKCISEQNLSKAQTYFNQLSSIQFEYEDEFVKTINKQIHFLKPKIDINYSEVQKAEEFSKGGNNKEALELFKNLISQNRLTELHHESYGWVIYRYIKAEESNLSSIDVRTFLRDYINLKNERPSLIHSMMLNFALHYSKDHFDFNLYNFFKLWNPSNLRNEDKEKQSFNDKEIPSLIARVFKEFIEKEVFIDVDYLISNIKMSTGYRKPTSTQKALDLLREQFFWKLITAKKEDKHIELWSTFNKYNQSFSNCYKTKWHSEILSLAERYMREEEEWRFLEFFKMWNPKNFLDEDWDEVKKDDKIHKPLAIKCLKKSFGIIKAQNKEFSESWLLPIYSKAVKLYPIDEWLLRENALLLIKNNELDSAINIYRKLVLELGDKSYIWNEFSSCYKDESDLKIGMLSKAIQLENNEDFLGDIRLELAKTLFHNGLVENCIVELNLHKKHRQLKGWRLSETYVEILNKTKDHNPNIKDNKSLYEKHISIAEQYAYEAIEWTELILIDKWKNDEGKERITLSNGKAIVFSIGSRRFNLLKQSSLGNVFNFKLHTQEIKKEVESRFARMGKTIVTEYKYIPLIIEKSQKSDWSILDDIYATIEYINNEKNIIHAITSCGKEVFFPKGKIQFQIGDFIKAKYFIKIVKDEVRIELKDVTRVEKEIAVVHFSKIIAVIDGINKEKNLFHFVGNKIIQGIVKLTETDIIPTEGKFLEIYYTSKKHRTENRIINKAILIRETRETNSELIKLVDGALQLKYKRNGCTFDYFDLMHEEDMNDILPDFGFVGDFYVPKSVLSDNNITTNCNIKATAIFSGDKWKIIKLDKV